MGNFFFGRNRDFERGVKLLSEQKEKILEKKLELKRLMKIVPNYFTGEMLFSIGRESLRFRLNVHSVETAKDCADLARLGKDVITRLDIMIQDIVATIEERQRVANLKNAQRELDKKATAEAKALKNLQKSKIIRSGQMKKSAKLAE